MSTKIEWATDTWNPLIGCTKVSAGCENCYAMKDARRVLECMAGAISSRGDGGTEKQRATHDAYAKVLRQDDDGDALPQWNGTVVEMANRLDQPLRWRKPRKIFVNSMSDLFHEDVSDEFIAAVFGVMAACPQHEFQVLTKRPERASAWFKRIHHAHHHFKYNQTIGELVVEKARDLIDMPVLCSPRWPLPNVILMASVEDQDTANERIPDLLDCPAAAYGVSYEPALGPVDFTAIDQCEVFRINALTGAVWETGRVEHNCLPKLDVIIVGGESGPNARPFELSWARSTIAACMEAEVSCFVKQLGACAIDAINGIAGAKLKVPEDLTRVAHRLKHPKGADMSEWPEDLRVQEWPDLAVKL